MINWKRVQELEEEIGKDEIGEVVELFLEEVESVIEPLRIGTTGRNLETDMHFLKGSALNLGFDTLGGLCSTGERMAAKGQAAEVSVVEIANTYDASKSEFLARMSLG